MKNTLPVLFALAREQQHKWARVGLFAVGILTALSAIFTYSRGALLGQGANQVDARVLAPIGPAGKDVAIRQQQREEDQQCIAARGRRIHTRVPL